MRGPEICVLDTGPTCCVRATGPYEPLTLAVSFRACNQGRAKPCPGFCLQAAADEEARRTAAEAQRRRDEEAAARRCASPATGPYKVAEWQGRVHGRLRLCVELSSCCNDACIASAGLLAKHPGHEQPAHGQPQALSGPAGHSHAIAVLWETVVIILTLTGPRAGAHGRRQSGGSARRSSAAWRSCASSARCPCLHLTSSVLAWLPR